MENNPNRLIGLILDRGPDQLIGLLGILKAGCGFVPIDPEYPLDRIDFMVRDSKIELLVTEAKYLEKALRISGGDHTLKHIICLNGIDEQHPAHDGVSIHNLDDSPGDVELDQPQMRTAGPARIAYLVYTSGSTGKPKGVPITHENLFPLLQWSKQYFNYGEHTRALQSLSFCFDFGIYEVLTTVFLGGTLYSIDKNQKMDPYRYAETVNYHAINTIHSTPSFFNELASCGCEVKALEEVHLGGEALLNSAVDQMFDVVGNDCAINNWYGPSETTVNSSVFEVGTSQASKGRESVTVPIGKASAKNTLYVLDRNGNLVPERVAGELYIGGPGLAPAYLNRPALTAERFIPSTFDTQPGARLYKTGDLVRRLPDGNIEFLGRIDHQIKLRGYRIELGEIENVLTHHPAVRETVVMVREDVPGNRQLVAYCVLDPEKAPSAGELRAFAKQELPDYMIPSAFVTLSNLPLTPNGKIDRRTLPVPDKTVYESEADFAAPRTPVEEVLAGICAEALGLRTIGVNDNLFDLGCHSLLATKIIARLRDALQIEFPLRNLFDSPTVAGLARNVKVAGSADELTELPPLLPAPRDENLPLSFAQEQVWFLCQLDAENISYNVPRAIRISGPFSVDLLEQTFTELIARHEILRTTFPSVDGRPIQVIHQPCQLKVPVIDIRALPEVDRDAEVKRLIIDFGRQHFDMARGPLLRLMVLEIGEEEFIFCLVEHHLVHDGWTQGVLLRDFLETYTALYERRQPSLPKLPIQYADFAYWQRRWLQGEVLEAQLSYWEKRLLGAPALLEVPTDRPRPPRMSFRGAMKTFELPPRLAQSLRELSSREGTTLFMTTLAAFKVLLHRYTNVDDVVVGTGIANRRCQEVEGLLGMIINTLVLRTDLSGDPHFRDLLKREREVCLGAYAYQDTPFEVLVERLQPARSLSYTPVFQVMFSFLDTPIQDPELPEMSLNIMQVHNQSVKFDLDVLLIPHRDQRIGLGAPGDEDRITVMWEYSTDLFDDSTIERMQAHFQMLLESVVANPEARISSLPMLTATERRQLLAGLSAADAEPGAGVTIHELFEAQVSRSPDAIALAFEQERLTYAELNRRANMLAHYLRTLGVGPDSIIGIHLDRSNELIVGIVGTLKAGGAYVPLDPSLPPKRLEFMVEDSRASVILSRKDLAEKLTKESARTVLIDSDWEAIARQSDEDPVRVTTAGSLAYVIYTSGSTGEPKGVMIRHSSLVEYATTAGSFFNLDSRDRVLQFASISFDTSAEEIYPCLTRGATLVLRTEAMLDSVATFLEGLSYSGITVLDLPTAYWHEICQGLDYEGLLIPAGLRLVIIGGERAVPEKLASWQKKAGPHLRLVNGYGPTETTVAVTLGDLPGKAEEVTTREVWIGATIKNAQVLVLDRHFELAAIGVEGEIFISGAGLARGYLRRADLTGERFLPNPHTQTPGERMYRTGDLGRYLPTGDVEFLGRTDNQVKVRGYRIELGEIEAVLRQQDGIKEAAVVARQDSTIGKRLVAYVVLEAGASLKSEEIRQRLKGQLPGYMAVSRIVLLDQMPVTSSGKLDRRRLAEEWEEEEEERREPRGPRSVLEEVLSGIFEQVLGRREVASDESFFDMGGHSLLAAQVVSRVRDAFSAEVGLVDVFEYQTVAGLAKRIELLMKQGHDEQKPIGPAERAGKLRLSFAQQRLWFLEQLHPGQAVYNIPAAFIIEGPLNVKALDDSINEVVRRHEVLRTRFRAENGVPVQVIEDHLRVELPVIDLSGLREEQREEEIKALLKQEAEEGFDIETAPLMRVKLLRESEEKHVGMMTMHHIVSDGWSMGVLVGEIGALYEAYCNGEESPLQELAIQYADYAEWQREWLQAEVIDQQMNYWKRQLEGSIPVLELMSGRSRPRLPSYRGARVDVRLNEEVSDRLREMSRREGVTLFMTLLAAFNTLLYRHTGQEDILIGAPTANRNRIEIEGLIGFFVNTLVLRTHLSANATFTGLLKQVRQVVLQAHTHQDIPFEKVIEELHPERRLGHSPLFQVAFSFENGEPEPLQLSGVTLTPLKTHSGTAKFDLTLYMTDREDELVGSVEYNSDLFDHSTIARLVDQFSTLIDSLLANPDYPISQLSTMSPAERSTILFDFNDTVQAYPYLFIHQIFERQVKLTPDHTCLIFGDESLSYRELNLRANKLAHYLIESGSSVDSLVGVCLHRSVDLVVSLLAVLKAGAAYVPLDPEHPGPLLGFMISDSRPALVLSVTELEPKLAGVKARVIWLDLESEHVSKCRGDDPLLDVEADNLAYVIYTSGSTGRPKGAMNTHGAISNRLQWMQQQFELNSQDRVLQKTPYSFDVSVWELFWPLMTGAVEVIAEPGGHRDSRYLVNLIKTEAVTTVHFVPSMLDVWLEEEGVEGCSCLKRVISSGEELTAASRDKYYEKVKGADLYNLYGPTEAAIDVTWWNCETTNSSRRVPVGRPIANTAMHVLDRNFELVPIGETGEIYISGAGLARGYFGAPDLTAERFLSNPHASSLGERIYRTGDLGRYLTTGELEFLGRADNQVKVRGHRIELGEIEGVLKRHVAVKEAAVVMQETKAGKLLAAYVVLQQDAIVSVQELRVYLREQLPDYMVAGRIVVLEALPMTASGKLNRRRLCEKRQEEEADTSLQREPRSAEEEVVRGIYEQVLGKRVPGLEESFFDMGGHSLMAAQVVSRVRKALKVEMGLIEVFEHPSVSGLAKRIESLMRRGQGEQKPIRRVERGGKLRLSFSQHRLWFIDQMEPGSNTYNISGATRLSGTLDTAALEKTFNEVVRRHGVLRSRFEAKDGVPYQIEERWRHRDIPVIDLQEVAEQERQAEVSRIAEAEAKEGFDLKAGNLLRVKLIREAETEHVLMMTMHHIISDRWSLGVLVKEIRVLYEAHSREEESPLEELSIQYADYAEWQREWLQAEVLEEQASYWKKQLGGSSGVLELRSERGRLVASSIRAGKQEIKLSEEVSEGLKELSRREGVTLFMTLLAGFYALLHRSTGQEEITIGTSTANRRRLETENLIGFFVNILALRTDVSGDPTFRELLGRVREVCLGAYLHQDLPFEKLVEILQPERDLGRSPLFQVFFEFDNNARPAFKLGDLTISSLNIDNGTSKFDLILFMGEQEGKLSASLEYNAELFDSAAIERMLDQFQRLLKDVVADPEKCLSTLLLFEPTQEQYLAAGFNDDLGAY